MARSNVPKFGNWINNDDNALYTVYFDEARKNRGQKMIFRNDTRRNSETANKNDPSNTPPSRSSPIKQAGPFGPGTGLEDRLGELRRFKNSPAAKNECYYGGRGPSPPAADIRSHKGINAESFERSFDKTSLPQARARLGIGSPSPARLRLRPDFTPTREYQIPDKGPTIPRFGEWNEKDPQSTAAGNFTYIFDRVREVRNTNNQPYSPTPTQTPNHPSTTYEPADPDHSQPKSCCFPRWW